MKKPVFLPALVTAAVCLFFCACTNINPPAPLYRITGTYALTGDKGWDYLASDDHTGRLYISHGDRVDIISEADGKLLGSITGFKGVHGIALAADLNKGFVSDGKDDCAVVFDMENLKILKKIRVKGRNPDAIVYDPSRKEIVTFNGRSSDLSILDAVSNTLIRVVRLPGKPEFAVSDGAGTIYFNIEDKSMIGVFSLSSRKIEKSWSLSPGLEPSGLALDNGNGILFSVCRNRLMIISDARSGKLITNIAIGSGPDAAVFDPDRRMALSSNGEGTLTLVQKQGSNSFRLIGNIITRKGARTMAINRLTRHLFLPSAEFTPGRETNKRPEIVKGSFTILDLAPQENAVSH